MTLFKHAQQLFLFVCTALFVHAQAWAGNVRIDDIRGTSGAGARKLQDNIRGQNDLLQYGLDIVMIVFGILGIILVGGSLYKLYQASQEQSRETPKSAIVGLVVGGCLIVLGVIAGLIANQAAG